ncbi:MAG TPA: threonine/serine dehydratase [Thermomicrobiales bacterium]|nr:threonine/serine dehydratase [Thermomicrobiales bacterium]
MTGQDEHDTEALWRSVTLDDIRAARERVMPHLHRTPMLQSRTLGDMAGVELGMKAEIFQRTGSFKSRGALNAVMQLSDEQKAHGVVTMSAGNHGQGLAFAAKMAGVRAVVFMPETAVPTKVEAIRGYGAEARFSHSMEDLFPTMDAYRQEHNLTFVSPFDDPAIVAGQGIAGLEILDDEPDVDTVIVPIGGGGLISGILVAIKSQRPEVRVIGVEPVGANVVKRNLEAGTMEPARDIQTIADGLAAPFPGTLTQSIIGHYVDDLVLVTDEEIADALKLILFRAKVLVEPAGAAATAALLTGKANAPRGSRVVTLLSGGNIDQAKLKSLL